MRYIAHMLKEEPTYSDATVYFDNAATTPMEPEVVEVMNEVIASAWANPSSPHAAGKRAHAALTAARETIADALGVEPEEIYFTSGSTESNNLAVRGASLARRDTPGQIVTSSLEHASVTRSVRGMRRDYQWPCEYIEAPQGRLDLGQLRSVLQQAPTTLITMMRVQNEVGWVFPIDKVAAIRDEFAPEVPLHCDATQAFGKMPTSPKDLGCELLTAGAHKIGGPRGIGILYVKKGLKLFTTAFGGGQEQGLRSGTEPVYLAAGMAKAVELRMARLQKDHDHVERLRNLAIERLRAEIPEIRFQGVDGVEVSPYILSISIPGVPSAKSSLYLSDHGVYVSRASACEENHGFIAPGTWREKHPLSLQAAGVPLRDGKQTLRLSFWHNNTEADVERFVQVLVACVRDE